VSEGQAGLPAKIREWLNSQGYPLEMQTLQMCREARLDADPSWFYLDKESGDYREADVRTATQEEMSGGSVLAITAIMECKQSRDKPWIVFTNSGYQGFNRFRFENRFIPDYMRDWWQALTETIDTHHLPYPLEPKKPMGYALVRALATGDKDFAYAALMAVTKAALGAVNDLEERAADHLKRHHEPTLYYSLVLPVLVIDAPLYTCTLGDDGEPVLNESKRCTLNWGNRVSVDQPKSTLIEVVTKQAVPELLEELVAATTDIHRIADRHSVNAADFEPRGFEPSDAV
jgi:hypothetical protein